MQTEHAANSYYADMFLLRKKNYSLGYFARFKKNHAELKSVFLVIEKLERNEMTASVSPGLLTLCVIPTRAELNANSSAWAHLKTKSANK